MRRRLAIAVLLVLTAAEGRAQGLGIGGPDMSEGLLFVPAFPGAILLDLTFEGRLDGIVEPGTVPLAESVLRGSAGYLHYLDGHGRLAVGGYLGVGAGLTRVEAEYPHLTRFDLGILARGRAMSRDYKHWTLALYAEFGVVNAYQGDQAPPPPPDAPLGTGTRWAVGVETGPGLLFHLSPYVFGEVVSRFGMEWMFFEDQQYAALTAGIKLNFDYALRGAD